ncbi:pentapeptide repeat-containing protein [Iningainema sp. BLCCT55]|uniref:Pentapeptide repeat-containing protein n=2 Tax=Iningainema TaxID=1932705 RepID=A0A8J7C3X2_9CYAN|nr:pentapeptide repeat-containing protein [Iningainema tapete BLCC-T55]
MKNMISNIFKMPQKNPQTVLLFDSIAAAQEVAFMLQGEWDGCNGVLMTKCDGVAVNTAASLMEAEWCYQGTALAVLNKLTTDALLRRYSRGERNFINANLRCAQLSSLCLNEINLSWAKLNLTNLSGSNLSKSLLIAADIQEGNLSNTNLNESQLVRANLTKANLSGSNLSGADLSRACLVDANLREADLRGANLSGANLRGSDLSGTILDNL